MKKRLAIYLSVIIGCLFIAFSAVYLLKSYESLDFVSGYGNEIYLNIEETEKLSIVRENPSNSTEISFIIKDDDVISFDLETGIITALKGGETTLTITTTRENLGPYVFNIHVGDGKSLNTPYYIKDVDDLKAIGGKRVYVEAVEATETTPAIEEVSHEWELDAYYKLYNNINLEEVEWQPIGSYAENRPFTGNFFGDNKTISNLTITEDQESAGLFAYVSDFAVIDSLKLNNVYINGNFDFVGSVAGASTGVTIIRVEVSNSEINAAPNCFLDEDELINAYLMAGGIVGFSDVQYWEEEGSNLDEFGYARTFITMTSFEGSITIHNNVYTLALSNDTNEVYVAFGGITGFNAGATILNNKTEVSFNIPANLATLSFNQNNDKVNINVGGVVGLTDYFDITKDAIVYPLIKNNLSLVSINNLTSRTGGVIGATTLDVQAVDGQQWIYDNYFYVESGPLTEGGSPFNNATTKINSRNVLNSKDTYTSLETNEKSWSIGESISVWSIVDGETAPTINFLNGIEQDPTYPSEVYTISNMNDFNLYYGKMTAPTTSMAEIISKKFWLSQTYVLGIDINLAQSNVEQIIPIGYDFTFMGSFDGNGKKIYFNDESGSQILFNNLGEDGPKYRFGGFFGVIGASAEVKNLTIQKLNIDYAQFVGGIAGINLGSIIDCYIDEIFVQDGQNVGLMVGYNSGIIKNINETSEEVIYSITASTAGIGQPTISIKDSDNSVYVGGIAGYNTGTISNIRITGNYTILCETTENNVIRVIGGAVGYNSGEIFNSSVDQVYINDSSKVRIFIGGFCGVNNGLIKRSYVGMEEGGLQANITTEVLAGNQIAGGFTALLDYNGILEQCFTNASITGYYAAGLAADLLGTANECYAKGSIEGVYIAGFACNMAFRAEAESGKELRGGKLTNSYNTISFNGISSNSIAAGVALFVRTPAVIEYCFVSNIFGGQGEKYYETFTNTRAKLSKYLTNKLEPTENLGTLNGVVINTEINSIVNEDVKTNNFIKILLDKSQNVYYWTESQSISGASAFAEIGFSAVGISAVWTIEEGAFPILTNLNLNNIPQNFETEIEDDFGDDFEDNEESLQD